MTILNPPIEDGADGSCSCCCGCGADVREGGGGGKAAADGDRRMLELAKEGGFWSVVEIFTVLDTVVAAAAAAAAAAAVEVEVLRAADI